MPLLVLPSLDVAVAKRYSYLVKPVHHVPDPQQSFPSTMSGDRNNNKKLMWMPPRNQQTSSMSILIALQPAVKHQSSATSRRICESQ
jgi:hypothetical protein